MQSFLYRFICPFVIYILPVFTYGQEFTCSVYDDQVETGVPFHIVYTSHSGEIENIQLPVVQGLSFSGRSGFSSSVSIIQGKKKSVFEYTYQAVIQKEGKFTIPPARGTINGKNAVSNAVAVKVAKSEQKTTVTNDGDVFFNARHSNEKIYSGQQTLLSYDIFTSKNVMNAEFVKKPLFKHLYLKPVDIKRQGKTVNISGKLFYTQTIDSYIVFAQKTGKHII